MSGRGSNTGDAAQEALKHKKEVVKDYTHGTRRVRLIHGTSPCGSYILVERHAIDEMGADSWRFVVALRAFVDDDPMGYRTA